MRRFLIGTAVVLVGFAALAVLFRGAIAMRVMRVVLERNLAADPIGDLPDGLHVMLCGAGGPLPDPARGGPCVAVVAGQLLLVIDAGSGAGRSLGLRGLPPAEVDAVLLTHFHSDHIDGLGELALLGWPASGRTKPLPVHGPPGVRDVVRGLNRAYRLDAGYRTAHHGPEVAPPEGAGMRERRFSTPRDGELVTVLERDGVVVGAFRVDHRPVEPAVGYRIDYGGRSVVVSGDTNRSENLLKFAKGVDLLVHEALSPALVQLLGEAAAAAGRTGLHTIALDILDYHASPAEVAELAEEAAARHLLYYHVVPPLRLPGLESVFLERVAETYSGDVTVGRDGTFVSLPRDSTSIHLTTR